MEETCSVWLHVVQGYHTCRPGSFVLVVMNGSLKIICCQQAQQRVPKNVLSPKCLPNSLGPGPRFSSIRCCLSWPLNETTIVFQDGLLPIKLVHIQTIESPSSTSKQTNALSQRPVDATRQSRHNMAAAPLDLAKPNRTIHVGVILMDSYVQKSSLSKSHSFLRL